MPAAWRCRVSSAGPRRRLDTEMLLRALLGWLRREPGHCRMVAIPTVAAEDRAGQDANATVWLPSAPG